MVSEWVKGIGSLLQASKELIISVATVEVLIQSLDIASYQEDLPAIGGNGSRVKGNLMIHLHRPLFEGILFHLVDLDMSLVPLEGMKSLLNMRDKAILNIVVNSHVSLHKVIEALDDLIRVLVQQALKSAEGFEFVEVLLKLRIKVCEDVQILLKHLNSGV